MKKFLAMILAAMMLLALAAPLAALTAAEIDATKGTITIPNAKKNVKYSVYRILDLHSFAGNAYSYKTIPEWYDFINSVTIGVDTDENPDTPNENVKIFTIGLKDSDDNYFVEWNGALPQTADNVAELAKLAAAWAKREGYEIDADDSITATTANDATRSTSITFEDLELGYYVIDTTLGTLCSLDTITPDATIYEKNPVPTVEKKVQEDFDDSWGETNDADIGQMVKYRTTINVAVDNHDDTDDDKKDTQTSGATNYMMHDLLSDGLTFTISETYPVVIKHVVPAATEGAAPTETTIATFTTTGGGTGSSNEKAIIIRNGDAAYTSAGCDEACTFFIRFDDDFIQSCGLEDQLVVEYYAELNQNAKLGKTAGNPNDVWLTYGEENIKSVVDRVITYTYAFEILKYELINGAMHPLNGAEFTLAKADGTLVNLVAVADGYRVATSTDTTTTTKIEAGQVKIMGLDVDTYSLTETVAPAGYNKVSLSIAVEVEETLNYVETETTGTGDSSVTTYTGGVQVENKKGSILPSTGGIGTTIFYIVGGFMMAAAVVLLVTKRKMAAEEND